MRSRILLTWGLAMAALVLGGGGVFYVVLAERYREDHDHELEETIAAAEVLYALDRGEHPTAPAAITHVMTELTTPDRTLAAYDAAGQRIAITRSARTAPDLSHVDPFAVGLTPMSRMIADHEIRMMRTALPDSLWLVVGVSDTTYLQRLRFLRLLLGTGLPILLLAGSALGVMVMRPLVAAERAVLEEQRRFLADAAHELRTPVAVLRSELDAARAAGSDPEALRTAFVACEREANQLGQLVDDLLFLARTDSLPPLARTRIFLDDVAQQAIGRLRRLPIAANRTIAVEDFEATPVLGDALLLERAIVVLLENALVHGGNGPIVLASGVHDGLAQITVRDHGPGVPPDQTEAIFERFRQLDASREGAGLGLPIARWIAERHGGTLTVEAAAPGARFILAIPAA